MVHDVRHLKFDFEEYYQELRDDERNEYVQSATALLKSYKTNGDESAESALRIWLERAPKHYFIVVSMTFLTGLHIRSSDEGLKTATTPFVRDEKGHLVFQKSPAPPCDDSR